MGNKVLESKMKIICEKTHNEAFIDSEIIQEMESAKKISGFNINRCCRRWRSLLMCAIKTERVELVRYLLADPKIDINYKGYGGDTALHYACDASNIHILKLLLNRRDINVNIRNKWGWTGLHNAGYLGYKAYIKELLLDARVDPSIRNNRGETTLDKTIRGQGQHEIVNMLRRIRYTSLLRIPNRSLYRDIVRMIIKEYA